MGRDGDPARRWPGRDPQPAARPRPARPVGDRDRPHARRPLPRHRRASLPLSVGRARRPSPCRSTCRRAAGRGSTRWRWRSANGSGSSMPRSTATSTTPTRTLHDRRPAAALRPRPPLRPCLGRGHRRARRLPPRATRATPVRRRPSRTAFAAPTSCSSRARSVGRPRRPRARPPHPRGGDRAGAQRAEAVPASSSTTPRHAARLIQELCAGGRPVGAPRGRRPDRSRSAPPPDRRAAGARQPSRPPPDGRPRRRSGPSSAARGSARPNRSRSARRARSGCRRRVGVRPRGPPPAARAPPPPSAAPSASADSAASRSSGTARDDVARGHAMGGDLPGRRRRGARRQSVGHRAWSCPPSAGEQTGIRRVVDQGVGEPPPTVVVRRRSARLRRGGRARRARTARRAAASTVEVAKRDADDRGDAERPARPSGAHRYAHRGAPAA